MKQYKAIFKTSDANGKVLYENKNHTFKTRDLNGYITKTIKRYASHNIKAEFTNIEEV